MAGSQYHVRIDVEPVDLDVWAPTEQGAINKAIVMIGHAGLFSQSKFTVTPVDPPRISGEGTAVNGPMPVDANGSDDMPAG